METEDKCGWISSLCSKGKEIKRIVQTIEKEIRKINEKVTKEKENGHLEKNECKWHQGWGKKIGKVTTRKWGIEEIKKDKLEKCF